MHTEEKCFFAICKANGINVMHGNLCKSKLHAHAHLCILIYVSMVAFMRVRIYWLNAFVCATCFCCNMFYCTSMSINYSCLVDCNCKCTWMIGYSNHTLILTYDILWPSFDRHTQNTADGKQMQKLDPLKPHFGGQQLPSVGKRGGKWWQGHESCSESSRGVRHESVIMLNKATTIVDGTVGPYLQYPAFRPPRYQHVYPSALLVSSRNCSMAMG